jgi:hypothetical protein
LSQFWEEIGLGPLAGFLLSGLIHGPPGHDRVHHLLLLDRLHGTAP